MTRMDATRRQKVKDKRQKTLIYANGNRDADQREL